MIVLAILISHESVYAQNDTMAFYFMDTNIINPLRIFYSELIIRQDSTYRFTYFSGGYDNSEDGFYKIRGNELIFNANDSRTIRTFLIDKRSKKKDYLFKSRSSSLLGYKFNLEGKSLNLDIINYNVKQGFYDKNKYIGIGIKLRMRKNYLFVI